jgi:hypothetical protein
MYGNKNNILVVFEGKAEIGNWAFRECTGITQLTIPEDVSIGGEAFMGCTGITQLIIPAGVSIGYGAFGRCTDITQLIIPKGVSIGDWAFGSCTGITQLTLPEGASIGHAAFGCTGITDLTIPEGVIIGEEAFMLCTGITQLTIQEGVNIGKRAFEHCFRLTSVDIPNSVISIGKEAFKACTSINTIHAACLFDSDQLRAIMPVRLTPLVTRESLSFSMRRSAGRLTGSMRKACAKLILLCGERVYQMADTHQATLPSEIWWCIIDRINREYVPEKVAPLRSYALMLTDGEKGEVEEYKQYKRAWQECRDLKDGIRPTLKR